MGTQDMKLVRQYDGYLARTVLVSTLLAFGVLFAVDSTIDLINDLESIGKRGFGVRHVLLMLLLGMPQRLYDLMPASLLLGTLLGLGHLAARNELEALRSVGVGRLRILGSVLAVGTVLVAFSMLVGETIAPTTEGYVRSLNKTSDLHKISIRSRHGLWTRDGPRFINVKQIFTDYRMTDVWVYEMDAEQRLKRVSFAKTAVYEGDAWRLSQVRHSLITEHGVQVSASEEESWAQLITPELFNVVTVKPEHMAAAKLGTYVDYLEQNGLNSQRYQLAFYNRFAGAAVRACDAAAGGAVRIPSGALRGAGPAHSAWHRHRRGLQPAEPDAGECQRRVRRAGVSGRVLSGSAGPRHRVHRLPENGLDLEAHQPGPRGDIVPAARLRIEQDQKYPRPSGIQEIRATAKRTSAVPQPSVEPSVPTTLNFQVRIPSVCPPWVQHQA